MRTAAVLIVTALLIAPPVAVSCPKIQPLHCVENAREEFTDRLARVTAITIIQWITDMKKTKPMTATELRERCPAAANMLALALQSSIDWEADFNRKVAVLETCLNARSGRYQVKLANVGNPDFRQDPDHPLPETTCGWARVETLRQASDLCRLYISFYHLGGGNWSGGEITDSSTGLVLGYVSYNGRIWSSKTYEKEILCES